MSTAGSITSTDSTTKRPRLKLKNTSGGNWRKEILGDITVMNPQEVGLAFLMFKQVWNLMKTWDSVKEEKGGEKEKGEDEVKDKVKDGVKEEEEKVKDGGGGHMFHDQHIFCAIV